MTAWRGAGATCPPWWPSPSFRDAPPRTRVYPSSAMSFVQVGNSRLGWRRPGIHDHDRAYGFRACADARPGMTGIGAILMPDNLRHSSRRRRVAAALGADDAVDDGHADAWKIAKLYAVQNRLARRMLRLVHEHEIGGASDFDQAAVERAHPRGVAGRKAERDFGGHLAERGQHRDHAQDAERLHAASGGRVGAENDAVEIAHLARGAQREQRRAFVAVVNELEPALAA